MTMLLQHFLNEFMERYLNTIDFTKNLVKYYHITFNKHSLFDFDEYFIAKIFARSVFLFNGMIIYELFLKRIECKLLH